MGICNQSICGASEWGDLLLLVIGRFAGMMVFSGLWIQYETSVLRYPD